MRRNYWIKIQRMGNKIGIYFQNAEWEKIKTSKSKPAEITIFNNGKSATFLVSMNQIVTIRKPIVRELKLSAGERVKILVRAVNNLKRSRNIFCNDKIDMLSLIPMATSRNYEIIVNSFRSNEEWIRAWYKHPRGSSRQIELKRFVDIEKFGQMLGQYQAEGTKSGKIFKLEFCNRLIQEHIDFANCLEVLGIDRSFLDGALIVHKGFKGKVDDLICRYQKEVGIVVRDVQRSSKAGSYGFKTYKRSVLLLEIILNALYVIRKKLIEEQWNDQLRIVADAFFSKLLTGDGTLDIQTNNREFNYPFIRIKIVDCNKEYLRDYCEIMKKLNFKSHINYYHINVKAICSLEKLFYLYRIRAFEHTNNWNKLLLCIDLCLKGRRYKTKYRFVELSKLKNFSNVHISKRYNVKIQSANDWLRNKEREGMVARINNESSVQWRLTEKAINLANLIEEWQKEFNALASKHRMPSSLDILNSIK